MLDAAYPTVYGLSKLVREYNKREFTYQGDVLRAFRGIVYALSSSFPGGFVSGLPAGFFTNASLWKSDVGLSRRKPVVAQEQTSVPSWSWAGWRGPLDYLAWVPASRWFKRPDLFKGNPTAQFLFADVIPTSEWSYQDDISGPATPLPDIWLEYK